MSDISETEWKGALIKILEDLSKSEFKKMLVLLEKIPKSKKTFRNKDYMARIIIEHYGLEESITAIKDVMDEVPRRDRGVQGLLQPFLDKLNNDKENEKRGEKRKRDPEEEDEERPLGLQISPDAAERLPECSMKGDNGEKKKHPWKKNIVDLNSRCELKSTDVIVGKVVQKSGLRTYQTKEKRERFFFYLAVADETDSVKLMVYGKERDRYKEGSSYMFRRLLKDAHAVKCTSLSRVSETKSVEVPEEIEEKGCRLIYPVSPLYSVDKAKGLVNGTSVSVEGEVTEIDPVTQKKLKQQRQKKKYQSFTLKDKAVSIGVSMWGNDVDQSKDLSVGDVVQVTNVKINRYYKMLSLNSTGYTRIFKVHSVGRHTVRMNIVGICKALKKETHLEAEFSEQVHTFVVASRLLAKVFGLELARDFKEKLVDELPLSAEAEIQGNKILDLKKCVNT